MNNNFDYLDGRITTVGSSITTLQSNIQSLNSTLSSQITQMKSDLEDSTSGTYVYNGDFNLSDVVFCDSLSRNIPNNSDHSEAIWLYSTPAYPYIPMTTQNTGTSYTFTNGGMVMCTSATNVTVGQGNASITFNGFVGILPVSMGSVVTTSQTAYFASY